MDKELLADQLMDLYGLLELQHDHIRRVAEDSGVDPESMRHRDGKWVMTDILTAKAQVLHGLALLGVEENKAPEFTYVGPVIRKQVYVYDESGRLSKRPIFDVSRAAEMFPNVIYFFGEDDA